MPGAGRADETKVLLGADPLEAGQVVEGGLGDRGGGTSNSSRVLVTGKAAAFMRPRALEASREAISASTRVRKKLLGLPALGLGHDQQLGARAGGWRREPQAPQPGLEVGGEREAVPCS